MLYMQYIYYILGLNLNLQVMEDKIDKLTEELRINNKLLSMILADRMLKDISKQYNGMNFDAYIFDMDAISERILKKHENITGYVSKEKDQHLH